MREEEREFSGEKRVGREEEEEEMACRCRLENTPRLAAIEMGAGRCCRAVQLVGSLAN